MFCHCGSDGQSGCGEHAFTPMRCPCEVEAVVLRDLIGGVGGWWCGNPESTEPRGLF